jgi:hypothetical protein
MYPFNVIWWVRVMIVACLMSLCIGATFVGTRWRFWDSQWQRNRTFFTLKKSAFEYKNSKNFMGK